MRQLGLYRKQALASVHVLAFGSGEDRRLVEAVESVQPPIPRDRKWVLIISSLFGCPVGCSMCDAGGGWGGALSADQILAQIDHLVDERYPDRRLPQDKFKIQFARMGEPALNPAVLSVLRALPTRYDAPGLLPSISTVAPAGRDGFFEELLDIKRELYPGDRFQLQFSVHTTDPEARRRLVPIRTWGLAEMAHFGVRFHRSQERKVTLNFAACRGYSIDPAILAEHFDPEHFLIKLTPLNPTDKAREAGLESWIDSADPATRDDLMGALSERGFEVILSIGELEENAIGSNCGQYVSGPEQADTAGVVRYESSRYSVM